MKINKNDSKELLILKAVISSIIILFCIFFFIFAPKRIFEKNDSFEFATSMVLLNDENFLLYDYEVYSNLSRFEQGLIDDIAEVNQAFKERSELMAVKVYGEEDSIEIRSDYVYIVSTETPELNIEYYIIRDLRVADVSMPCRTFIMLFDDLSTLVNNIYLVVLLIITLAFLFPSTIRLTKLVIWIKDQKKTVNNHKEV